MARLVASLFREDLRFLSGETIHIDGAQDTDYLLVKNITVSGLQWSD